MVVTGTLTRPLGELRFESGVPGGSQLKEVEKLPSAKPRSASATATRYPTNRHTLPITLRYLPNTVFPTALQSLRFRFKRSPNFPRSLLYLDLIVTSFRYNVHCLCTCNLLRCDLAFPLPLWFFLVVSINFHRCLLYRSRSSPSLCSLGRGWRQNRFE